MEKEKNVSLRTVWGVLLILLAGALTACGSGSRGMVRLSPNAVTLSTGQSQTFSVTVTECPGTKINWSVREFGDSGTVTNNGVYTAPSTPGEYHVVATCEDDSGVYDVATVTVL